MFVFEKLIRKNIKELEPYSSARSDFTKEADIFIDANENPYNTGFNRYPDPFQKALKSEISKIKGISTNRIFFGNGSDEVIDLLMRCIGEPGKDNIITFVPSYTMYKTSAQVNNLEVRSIDLNNNFSIPVSKVKTTMDENTKILFICTPNNPLGNIVPRATIEECCKLFNGIVVVDEAYIDFSSEQSSIPLLDKYPNLMVMQTLSKAYGMAGLRLGMCFTSEEIIAVLNKVKPPYNISSLSQEKALEILKDRTKYETQIKTFIEERERLYKVFVDMDFFTKVCPSEANFILVTSPYFKSIYNYLVENKVIVRLRDIPPLIACGIRFSIGIPEENTRVISLLTDYINNRLYEKE